MPKAKFKILPVDDPPILASGVQTLLKERAQLLKEPHQSPFFEHESQS